jgi:hypothetical protein
MDLSISDKLTIMCEYSKIVSSEDIVAKNTIMGKILEENNFNGFPANILRTTHVIAVYNLQQHINTNLKKRASKQYAKDNPELIESVFENVFLKLHHAQTFVNKITPLLIAHAEKIVMEKNVVKNKTEHNTKPKVKI